MSLISRTIAGFACLAVAMGGAIFPVAGTLRYWQGWAYLALFFTASILITIHLARNDPALLRRRLSGGPFAEPTRAQKFIMTLASIGFAGLVAVPALDARRGWSHLPAGIALLGDVAVAAGFVIVFLVFRENGHAAATVRVERGQTVIATGPYSIVRHPMYAGGLLMLAGTPVALGSVWGLLVFPALLPVLIWRLIDEERYLTARLPGYAEYCRRIRARLIPGLF
jgi:protein-S-isoprenylcysteine O-methyltransferase Ste14